MLCAGFCTLLFGGMAAHSQHVNANLLAMRNFFHTRSVSSALQEDASRISFDGRQAEEKLIGERQER
jgi:hypothetical protein